MQFTPIGMRAKVTAAKALVINTCGQNDTAERGTFESWSWSNPTNRAITHFYTDIQAVSLECLWQGTKLKLGQHQPDPEILNGNWRKAKGKRPVGAYAGPGQPLIITPGEARRRIYIPAFRNLIDHWLQDAQAKDWVERAKTWDGPVFLRDHDTGQGIDRNGPMSHAWVLSIWLNTGNWPN